jgi:hypothetical protein
MVIELNAIGENRVTCQGLQESWVIGKAEALGSYLRTIKKRSRTNSVAVG